MYEQNEKSPPLKETTNCAVPREAAVRRSGGGGVAYHTPRQMQHLRQSAMELHSPRKSDAILRTVMRTN